MMLAVVVSAILTGLALRFMAEFSRGLGYEHHECNIIRKGREGLRLVDDGKLGEGDIVRLRRTGEAGRIVHVFSVHPFKGDVVVLVGERRELCSVDELEKAEA